MAYSSLGKLQEDLRNLLVRDLERCIKHFLSLVSEKARLHEDLIQLSARFNYSKRENLGGRMSAEDYGTERNKMSTAMIDYISNLEAEDLKPGTIDASLGMDLKTSQRETLTGQAKLLVDLISRLEQEIALQDDPKRLMRYEIQLRESEARLATIREKLNNL